MFWFFFFLSRPSLFSQPLKKQQRWTGSRRWFRGAVLLSLKDVEMRACHTHSPLGVHSASRDESGSQATGVADQVLGFSSDGRSSETETRMNVRGLV